ncbi:MAG: helix-turn-helix domain-containing protein [Burkholderiales bacterium]|nr:helix-turn-helix domain-containing protein [Burkholderiales bacterium]
MSDEPAGSSAPVPDTPVTEPAVAPPQTTAGQLLRQAREAAKVELPALALALKVSVKKLETLEADRLDLLPDAVFVRALASSVCRALKIDAAPVLAQLPQSKVPRLDYDEPGLNTPFHTPGDVAKTPFLDRLSRPMVLAALAVLLGALVLIFFPSTEQRAEIGAIVTRAPAAAGMAEPVPAPVVATPAPGKAPVAPAAVQPAAAAAKTSKDPEPVARPETPPAATPAPAVAVSPEVLAVRKRLASSGVVIFKTSGPSWIEVTDGKGAIQLSRLVEPGEPVGASGPLPLTVTIGRADVTEVLVRGKPFPLDEVTRGGVARFEVK